MNNPNPLINIGDLAKPANTLIEKISDAIGGIYKPHQIRRVAQAEAEADKIRAVTQIEITDLQRRAMTRFFVEEAKKQSNIEAITSKALPQVTEEAKPDQIEDDWITHFFEKGRLISDDEMQNLWSRILAGQANSPGSYTKKTVEILSNLEKVDANAFSKLCGFNFQIGTLTPLIYNSDDKIYNDNGIKFSVLAHLESLGLIHFDPLAGYIRKGLRQQGDTVYFGTTVWIGFQNVDNIQIDLGHVLLTQAGSQLAPICGAQPVDGFIDYVRGKWKSLGYRTEPEAMQSQADNVQPNKPES